MAQSSNFTAVILGASGGIGSALARRLHKRKGCLILAGRDREKLGPLTRELGCEVAVCDPTQVDEVEGLLKKAAKDYGSVEAIANCVGTLLLKPVHLTTWEEWQETLRINLGSAFATVRSGVKVMSRTGGSIVLCSTAASLMGIANHEAIAAAKGGINGLVLSAAATYASKGIRVNAVAPGMTRTPLTERLTSNEALRKGSEAMHALGRIGEPDEVAAALEFFMAPENNWVTGQILAVDGGLSSLAPRRT
ncbi:MAG TPA: SDR family oxidoreductase [Acidobacteriota bacterium]|nr:SDR family oxidoreductase [Acidobacteriota bacterium]